jgi:hypothetical protein
MVLAAMLSTSPIQCSNDDSRLLSLSVESAGQNRIVGFRPWTKNYTIGTTEGVDTITVRANAASTEATIEYSLPGAIPEDGTLGTGSGEVVLTIPVNTPLTLSVAVTDGESTQTYIAEINRSCVIVDDCEDGNTCTATSCNAGAVCDITQLADTTPCDFNGAGDGICNDGECLNNLHIVNFESFEPADQNLRLGVELPSAHDGFEWAYADPAKIADSTCTTATATTCWGSWAVSDEAGDDIPAASGHNWMRARSANQGKGAKITKLDGFVFRSMQLYTHDPAERPAFVDEVIVTARTAADPSVDISTPVSLQANTWIEVTAEELGVEDVELKSIWFNSDVSSPNSGKFGLDNFAVLKE